MLEFEAATVTFLSDAKKSIKPMTLKSIAESDPEVRGFLRAIRDTGMRARAVELLTRQIESMKRD